MGKRMVYIDLGFKDTRFLFLVSAAKSLAMRECDERG